MPTQYLNDGVLDLSLGMNAGDLPQLLEQGEAAYILNGQIGNGFLKNRPALNYVAITGVEQGIITASRTGRFYGCAPYTSDAGVTSLMASIGGELYQFTPQYDSEGNPLNAVFVTNQTGGSGGQLTIEENPSVVQHWLKQAERWIIWNDGVSLPLFWDGSATPTTIRRSLGQAGASFNQYGVMVTAPELGPGRMLAYGQGQVWEALPDGYSFLFSDPVGYSSGTLPFNFRDAVLKLKINSTVISGGNFRVPSSTGTITGLTFTALLDATLGTGPLQVFTQQAVYGCTAPEIPSSWLTGETPLLTASLEGAGGASNYNASVNGDIFFRSSDGQIRSLFMARRDFNQWGNTPVSYEVSPYIQGDDQSLLPFTQTFEFDNQVMQTVNPVEGPLGVYCQKLVNLSLENVSGIREKTPPAYNGIWNIGNVLGVVVATFNGVERCYAFLYNSNTNQIDLVEILPKSSTQALDGNTNPITMQFVSRAMFWRSAAGEVEFYRGGTSTGKSSFDLIKLEGGELAVQEIMQGKVSFTVEFKSVYDTNWHPWYSWTVDNTDGEHGYQPRMGLGIPPNEDNEATEMPAHVDYAFQVRVTVVGSCRIMALRLYATKQNQPELAKPFVQE